MLGGGASEVLRLQERLLQRILLLHVSAGDVPGEGSEVRLQAGVRAQDARRTDPRHERAVQARPDGKCDTTCPENYEEDQDNPRLRSLQERLSQKCPLLSFFLKPLRGLSLEF